MSRGSSCLRLALAFLPLAPLAGHGQTSGSHAGMTHGIATPTVESAALDALLAATRRGTERFADRRAAIAAGYRRAGMDFPSMGEHWINPSKLVAGGFDPAVPAILTYAVVEGRPRLLGVVYAVALGPNERPPALPGGAGAWHEHNGSIDEESLLPEHGGGGGGDHAATSPGAVPSTRLAILHAWTVVGNPAGTFVAENWALPFIRNGLTVPSPVPLSAARALALASGGEEYFRRLFLIGANRSDARSAGSGVENDEAALRLAVGEAQRILNARKSPNALSAGELTGLSRTWERFTASIGRMVESSAH